MCSRIENVGKKQIVKPREKSKLVMILFIQQLIELLALQCESASWRQIGKLKFCPRADHRHTGDQPTL